MIQHCIKRLNSNLARCYDEKNNEECAYRYQLYSVIDLLSCSKATVCYKEPFLFVCLYRQQNRSARRDPPMQQTAAVLSGNDRTAGQHQEVIEVQILPQVRTRR